MQETAAQDTAPGAPAARKTPKWPFVLVGVIVVLMFIGANSDVDALCKDGERVEKQGECNTGYNPCPSGVEGCEDGCTWAVCYDKAGNPTRRGWVAK